MYRDTRWNTLVYEIRWRVLLESFGLFLDLGKTWLWSDLVVIVFHHLNFEEKAADFWSTQRKVVSFFDIVKEIRQSISKSVDILDSLGDFSFMFILVLFFLKFFENKKTKETNKRKKI